MDRAIDEPHPPTPEADPVGPAASTSAPPTVNRARPLGPALAALRVLVAAVVARPSARSGDGLGPLAPPGTGAAAGLAVGPEVGELAPDFRLQTTGGAELRLSDLRGRAVVLDFRATWCLFCVTGMPARQGFADRCGGAVAAVGVDVGEDAGQVRRFAEQIVVRYPLPLDPDFRVTDAFAVTRMPATFVIGRQGGVGGAKDGAVTPRALDAWVAPLLGGREALG